MIPKKDSERQAWAEQVARDGVWLLEQLDHGGLYPELVNIPAVDILRRVWLQNVSQIEGQVSVREPKDQPPSAQRITSPDDLDARYSTKRDLSWTGDKVHLTETCDEDLPHLIIDVETRSSTEPDHVVTAIVHDHLAQAGYLPNQHFVDQGYMSVEQLVSAHEQHQIQLMGSVPDDNSWQSRQAAYDSRHFTIDWDQACAFCPQGKRSQSWSLAQTRSQHPVVKIKFRHADCSVCPVMALCTENQEKGELSPSCRLNPILKRSKGPVNASKPLIFETSVRPAPVLRGQFPKSLGLSMRGDRATGDCLKPISNI